jgi:hypothetical protein
MRREVFVAAAAWRRSTEHCPNQEDKYKACRLDQIMPESDDFDHTITAFASPLSDRLPRGHARRQERRTASTDRAALALGR